MSVLEQAGAIRTDCVLGYANDGTAVSVDFAELIGQHTLIAAKTGGGKSVCMRKVLELSLANGLPVIVLDCDGAYASLRDAAPNGILVIGGDAGDVDLTADQLIRKLDIPVSGRVSVVVNLAALPADDQVVLVGKVLDRLMSLPDEVQQPYLVAIDEVQLFAPQSGRSASSGAIANVAKRGRKRGLSLLVATQRLPDVDKQFTTQMGNRLFGKFTDATDHMRVRTELGLDSTQAKAFATMRTGEFLVTGEAFSVQGVKVMIGKPRSGTLGKDTLVARLADPIAPVEEVLARLRANTRRENHAGRPASQQEVEVERKASGFDESGKEPSGIDLQRDQRELLAVLAAAPRSGLERDALALLVGSMEKRAAFQAAVTHLLADGLAAIGTGSRIRITPEGAAAVTDGRSFAERLATLRERREASDQRIVACLAAAGKAALDPAVIRERTGLGPRVAKAALSRLRRDGWIVERGGRITCSPALSRLPG
ncbi:DUF87 domain-containing protein [Mesorhizobium sp. VK25A]|uniref:DUF87 domain-containing protein n=1 Tax=Mesorhizobium vachelliae TaxID=3072309 RepID=A0ABU4ZXH0_9HYPH|nr:MULTISPECIES: DUF87 domain-containing protein [unclassified Mesorhizobium]MDX8530093.1 DUF87 domain-containing protein [Mesorhizobium sp. VK25D]MDX8544491.1 DUF87 domain-containing protein [Mesorhizobium sp. VK25A]